MIFRPCRFRAARACPWRGDPASTTSNIGYQERRELSQSAKVDFQEVGFSKEIISRSETVFRAADASKFERKAPARIASLAANDLFLTDRAPPMRFQSGRRHADRSRITKARSLNGRPTPSP